MPIHTLPTAQEQQIAKQAKDFLSSPSYARDFMNQAKQPPPDPWSMGFGQPMAPQQGPMPSGEVVPAIPDGMVDRDWLAGALQSEGGSLQDKQYIASVIGNRLASGRWGNSLKDVILAPGQFSAFNKLTGYAGGEQGTDHWRNPSEEAYQVADALIGGQIADQTGGALNYYTTWGGQAPVPKWGGQGFYRLPGSTHYFGVAR